jgi:hypothetical protein
MKLRISMFCLLVAISARAQRHKLQTVGASVSN